MDRVITTLNCIMIISGNSTVAENIRSISFCMYIYHNSLFNMLLFCTLNHVGNTWIKCKSNTAYSSQKVELCLVVLKISIEVLARSKSICDICYVFAFRCVWYNSPWLLFATKLSKEIYMRYAWMDWNYHVLTVWNKIAGVYPFFNDKMNYELSIQLYHQQRNNDSKNKNK